MQARKKDKKQQEGGLRVRYALSVAQKAEVEASSGVNQALLSSHSGLRICRYLLQLQSKDKWHWRFLEMAVTYHEPAE